LKSNMENAMAASEMLISCGFGAGIFPIRVVSCCQSAPLCA
jgi:hypothetical protein